MQKSYLNEWHILSELLLNYGFTKVQLSRFLGISIAEMDFVLYEKSNDCLLRPLKMSLLNLYSQCCLRCQ